MSARETLHSDLLTTPAAQKLPQPEGWASTRIKRYRDEVRTETLAEVAEMLDRVGHPAAALVLRYADEAAGPEEKTTPNAGTAVTPQLDSITRQQRLLSTIRQQHGRGRWRTSRVEHLYRDWGVHYPRSNARSDLQALHLAGHLTERGPVDGRFYTLNTRKDGQR
ncbi:hypothetical protein [Streptomyces scopuliridis]|uniref:Uncharacterized protein n=1 Tax=Streptomyces scopuliridis RB72 TaxID=1440053 RepID=A0A2T7SNY1_9ACTN|nr:hypothetical protein [Streptomyces scopuliridis]PVE04635.1 hypothetical protein Y717_10595 [Streptomyces scopuliridis RB72]